MFVFFSKLLPLFVYPIGLTCLLVTAALLVTRRPRLTRSLLLAALLILWLSSTAWMGHGLVRTLETRHAPLDDAAQAEIAVVLGGATRPQLPPRTLVEMFDSGDRLTYAAWLYQQGRVERLLLTGGGIDFLGPEGIPSEAENMATLLEQMGVPREAILLETEARNTYENALFSRQLLEEASAGRVLLVTSALHMPRAVALFERQGLNVVPAPTDYLTTDAEWAYLWQAPPAGQVINLLPATKYQGMTTEALKEYIGLVVYRLRGWL